MIRATADLPVLFPSSVALSWHNGFSSSSRTALESPLCRHDRQRIARPARAL